MAIKYILLLLVSLVALDCVPKQAPLFDLQIGMPEGAAMKLAGEIGWHFNDSTVFSKDTMRSHKVGIRYQFQHVRIPALDKPGSAFLWFEDGKLTLIYWKCDEKLLSHAKENPSITDFNALESWARSLYGVPDDSTIDYKPFLQSEQPKFDWENINVQWGRPSLNKNRNRYQAQVFFGKGGLLFFRSELLIDSL